MEKTPILWESNLVYNAEAFKTLVFFILLLMQGNSNSKFAKLFLFFKEKGSLELKSRKAFQLLQDIWRCLIIRNRPNYKNQHTGP